MVRHRYWNISYKGFWLVRLDPVNHRGQPCLVPREVNALGAIDARDNHPFGKIGLERRFIQPNGHHAA